MGDNNNTISNDTMCFNIGLTNVYYVVSTVYSTTINQEIFVYENIHVLNIHVNKFSRVPHKNFNTKICQVEITVHVSPTKRLLATYASLFCYRNS